MACAGHDVVRVRYLDFYQSTNRVVEPHAWPSYMPLSKVYDLEPIPPQLAPEFHRHILGAEANLWTEYVSTPQHLEYMAFPRLCALAEVAWTPAEKKQYNDFCTRLPRLLARLDVLGINYRKPDFFDQTKN